MNGPPTTTLRLREDSIFHFLIFLFKVRQNPLKSMHLSPFVPSVIFGRIPKSQKMVPRPTPCTLEKTTFFFNFYFLFKVRQTPLKSMHLSPFDPSVIFGRIPKSQKMVPQTTTPHLRENSTIFYFNFLFKVLQTLLKSMHLSPFYPISYFRKDT